MKGQRNALNIPPHRIYITEGLNWIFSSGREWFQYILKLGIPEVLFKYILICCTNSVGISNRVKCSVWNIRERCRQWCWVYGRFSFSNIRTRAGILEVVCTYISLMPYSKIWFCHQVSTEVMVTEEELFPVMSLEKQHF